MMPTPTHLTSADEATRSSHAKRASKRSLRSRLGASLLAAFVVSVAAGACDHRESAGGGGCDGDPTKDPDRVLSELKPVTQFDKIFVIGDSLSDTHRMGSGWIPYCPNSKRGYWNRRFSNGYLWIDYLTMDNPGLEGKIGNYAVGGSGVLAKYGSGILGMTEKQAQDLVKENPASIVSNSMVIVWAGANDVKEVNKEGSATDFGNAVFNKLRDNTIEYLANQGVEHFVLVGLPRIDLVPQGQKWSAEDRDWVEIAVNVLNDALAAYAKEKEYVYLDVAEKIGEILDGTVTSVNMTDLSQPCWDGPNCAEQGDLPGRYQDQRCEGKMFFDRVHPTTGAHCGIAKWMEQAISTQYVIDGGDKDLESCARRAQTETASWGALPTNHTEPRPIKFKAQTPINPTEEMCVAACKNAGNATWDKEMGEWINGGWTVKKTSGNISLPDGSTVGYCACSGGDGSVSRELKVCVGGTIHEGSGSGVRATDLSETEAGLIEQKRLGAFEYEESCSSPSSSCDSNADCDGDRFCSRDRWCAERWVVCDNPDTLNGGEYDAICTTVGYAPRFSGSDELVQYTPDQAKWDTFATKPFAGGTNTAHDPDGVGWISPADWAAAEWDGTIYNPSQMTKAEFAAAICPSVDRLRGIREVFYAHQPFADVANPTKAEVDEWHRIAINHVRALVGYTSEDRQVEKDHCMFARALWADERKFTTQWDDEYPGTTGSAAGPCQGSSNAHCGASFIPSLEDQAPYLPDGHPGCGTQQGAEGISSGPKSNIPWSIKWSRGFCNTLLAEGYWGGHVGPWFHRQKFGFSFWDNDPADNGNNAILRAKWTGDLMPNLYCNPADPDCDPANTGP